MTQYTKNFTVEELQCKCGCGFLPPLAFMNKMQTLRDRVGFPLKVTSGGRCPEYNAKVSSTGLTGPHTKGAIDLSVSREQAYEVLFWALDLGFKGIGVQQKGSGRFIHLDSLPNEPGQPRPTIWSY